MITLIDRESVFRVKPKAMNEKVKRESETGTIAGRSYAKGWNACLKMWHEEIENIPLVERTKGTWLPIIETNEFGEPYQAGVHCSNCGHMTVYESNFCPDCGVIMDDNPIVDIQIGSCSEFSNNSDYSSYVSRQAVKHLDLFTKTYCRDKSVEDDLIFRCDQCYFQLPSGICLVKAMARKLCPDYRDFGCMGDL